eukprot:scaffold69489_cov21-Phaeocystis_antarctica.AAC.1
MAREVARAAVAGWAWAAATRAAWAAAAARCARIRRAWTQRSPPCQRPWRSCRCPCSTYGWGWDLGWG